MNGSVTEERSNKGAVVLFIYLYYIGTEKETPPPVEDLVFYHSSLFPSAGVIRVQVPAPFSVSCSVF